VKFAMESGALARYLSERERIAGLPEAAREAVGGRADRALYRVADGVAHLEIRGTLMNDPSWIEELLGLAPSLTYDEIVEAIDRANADEAVGRIVLEIDSPGGYVDGVDYAATAIAASDKPVEARVGGMAASAAYWLASQADRIVATSRLSAFGSIGVALTAFKEPGVYQIASRAAPKKRPDPETPEGQAAIREELDAIHAIFAGDVARGRGVDLEKVNADFGQGGTMLAERALAAGMIDALEYATSSPAVGGSAESSAKDKIKGRGKMTLEQIKAEAPEIVAALHDEGVQAERKRVADLAAFRGINADGDKAVEEAIASGKSYAEVAPQIGAAVARGKSKEADGDNAPDVETASAENASGANASTVSAEDRAWMKKHKPNMTDEEIEKALAGKEGEE